MPRLRFVSKNGEQKARVSALRPGEVIVVSSLGEAQSLRQAAYYIGARMLVRQIAGTRHDYACMIISGGAA